MASPHTPTSISRENSPSISDSSEAVEDNRVVSGNDENGTPRAQRWEARLHKDLTPTSKRLKNGKYGMFSDKIPVSPWKTTSPTSTGQQFSRLAASGKKRRRILLEDTDEKREGSPLFEPEVSAEENSTTSSDDDDVVMRRPRPFTRSIKRLKHRTTRLCTRDNSQRDEPIEIPDGDSECEITAGVRDMPASPPDMRLFQAAAAIFKDSPLSGNAAVLPEYVGIIEKLSEQYSAKDSELVTLRAYHDEDTRLAEQLENIPAKQDQQNKAIAKACAVAVLKDMKEAEFSDVKDIQEALEKRQAEAEKEKVALLALMQKREAKYEVRRQAIVGLEAAAHARLREIEDKIEGLKMQKGKLEEEGGCALGYEIRKKVVAKLRKQGKKR